MSGKRPRFSIIIPAHNEEAYLPRLFDSIDRARDVYAGGDHSVEIIVVDNLSTDRTREIAETRGCRIEFVERRIIGAVRNGGARVAHGEILAFVDADAQLHPQTFREIDNLLRNDAVIGGATGFRFERSSLGLRCTYALLILLAFVLRGVRTVHPFNVDGGVTFCRRSDFFELGGYPESLLFAEDVRFLLALKRRARARGQKLVSGTNAKAVFSTRKFDRYGDWHYFLMPVHIAWSFVSGREGWARSYWYGRGKDA